MTDITGAKIENRDIVLLIEPSIPERKLALGIVTRQGKETAEVSYLPLEKGLDEYQAMKLSELLGGRVPSPCLYRCKVNQGQVIKLEREEIDRIRDEYTTSYNRPTE